MKRINGSGRVRRTRIYWIALATAAVMPASVAAQSTTPAASSDPNTSGQATTPAEIVVTGTLIKGLQRPTGAALVNLDAKTIQATGQTAAGDVLNQTIPQLPSFNTLAVGSADAGLPVTKIGLRGIGNTSGSSSGQTSTLVLINGHRIVPVGILSTDPDPDLIPADILESIQVMPDGGSATYGSDAIGGVVNFVTKKRLDGLSAHYEHRFADDYNEDSGNISFGKSWSSGNAYISATYTRHDAVFGKDRDYTSYDFSGHGGTDYRSNSCPYGNFSVNGQTYTAPGFTALSSSPRCEGADYTSLTPRENRINIFGYIEQDLTSNLKFSMDAFYGRRHDIVYSDIAETPGVLTIDASNPYFHPVAGETSQTVNFTFARGLGNYRASPQRFEQYQFDPSIQWTLSDRWQLRGDFLIGKSFSVASDRTGLNNDAITSTDVDPYDTAMTDPSVLADIANHESFNHGVNGLRSGQLVANGQLFDLPGGPVKIAIGGEVRRQTLTDTNATGAIGDRAGAVSYPAARTVTAAFAEAFIPIVSEQNSMTLVRGLALDAAVRYDHYSDFGGTTNPRIGVDYKPMDDLVIRGNYQTSFVAPSLADDGDLVDTRLQIVTLFPGNYLGLIAGAGQNLKPQTSRTFSIGADWTPKAIPGLHLGATYWNTKVDNLVSLSLSAYGLFGALSSPYSLCGAGLFGAGGAFASPNGACTLASVLAAQPLYNRFDPSGAAGISTPADLFKPGNTLVNLVDARRSNFGTEKISGIDFQGGYTTNVSFGSLYMNVSGTYLLQKKISAVSGGDYVDYLSGKTVLGATARLNVVATVGGVVGPVSTSVTVRHNSGYDIPAGTSVGQSRVGGFTVADIALSLDLEKIVGFKKTAAYLTVLNVFDQDPPYYGAVPTAGSLAGFANGGTLGREFAVGIRTSF